MTIRTSQTGAVTTLSFDRVDRKNAITADMYALLADGLTAAAADPRVRVVVLQGHESVFTAGNDLGDFMNNPPAGEGSPVFRFLQAISVFPKPLIGAVCGVAVGVGTTMLLHCDVVYAGDNARLLVPFVNLGLCPEAASSLLLPRIAGHARAAEMLMFGEPVSAAQALDFGIVNQVLPAAEVNAYAQARATLLAEKPISSLLAIKSLMKRSGAADVASAMAAEGELFRRMLGEPAAREAFAAFMAKRKPDFSTIG